MSELFERANKLAEEERELQLRRSKFEREQEEARERSRQRASEFISLMRQHEIPTTPMYANAYRRHYSRWPGLESGTLENIQCYVGQGWVVKNFQPYDEYAEGEELGVWLSEDGTSLQQFKVSGDIMLKDGGGPFFNPGDEIPEHIEIELTPLDNRVGSDEGLNMLAQALRDYGIYR